MQVKMMTQQDQSLLIQTVLLCIPKVVYNILYILHKSDIMG